MFPLIKYILRLRTLRENASHIPTKAFPLRNAKSAIVFLDSSAYDHKATADRIKTFFELRHIDSVTIAPGPDDVNWYGKPKDYIRDMLEAGENSIYISLIASNNYTATFCAMKSTARFKIGREQIRGHIFDLLVTGNTENRGSQTEAFNYIIKLIEQIQ